MQNGPLEIANNLKQEAHSLLHQRGVHSLLSKYGDLIYAGSYALDLMAWPDIDMNLIIANEKEARDIVKCCV